MTLEEENIVLKKRIKELEGMVAELRATNEIQKRSMEKYHKLVVRFLLETEANYV